MATIDRLHSISLNPPPGSPTKEDGKITFSEICTAPVSPTQASAMAAAKLLMPSETDTPETLSLSGLYRGMLDSTGLLTPYIDKNEGHWYIRSIANEYTKNAPDQSKALLLNLVREKIDTLSIDASSMPSLADRVAFKQLQEKCRATLNGLNAARCLSFSNAMSAVHDWNAAYDAIVVDQVDASSLAISLKALKATNIKKLFERIDAFKKMENVTTLTPDQQQLVNEHIESVRPRNKIIDAYLKKLESAVDMREVINDFVGEYFNELQQEKESALKIAIVKGDECYRLLDTVANSLKLVRTGDDRAAVLRYIESALELYVEKNNLHQPIFGKVILGEQIRQLHRDLDRLNRLEKPDAESEEQIQIFRREIKEAGKALTSQTLLEEWRVLIDGVELFEALSLEKAYANQLPANEKIGYNRRSAGIDDALKDRTKFCLRKLEDIVIQTSVALRKNNPDNTGQFRWVTGTSDELLQGIAEAENASIQWSDLDKNDDVPWDRRFLDECQRIAEAHDRLRHGFSCIVADSESGKPIEKNSPEKLKKFAASAEKIAKDYGVLRAALECQVAITSSASSSADQDELGKILSDLDYRQLVASILSRMQNECATLLRSAITDHDEQTSSSASLTLFIDDDVMKHQQQGGGKNKKGKKKKPKIRILPSTTNVANSHDNDIATPVTTDASNNGAMSAVLRRVLEDKAKASMRNAKNSYQEFHSGITHYVRERGPGAAVTYAKAALADIDKAIRIESSGTDNDNVHLTQVRESCAQRLALYEAFANSLMSKEPEVANMLMAADKEGRLIVKLPDDGHDYFRNVSAIKEDRIFEVVIEIKPLKLNTEESGRANMSRNQQKLEAEMALHFERKFIHIHVQNWVRREDLRTLEDDDIVCAHFKSEEHRLVGRYLDPNVQRFPATKKFAISLAARAPAGKTQRPTITHA